MPHVNIGGNANLDQGKENLRSDYVCLSNTPSPTLLAGQKVVHKVSRVELGDHCLGHNHLRRIQLSLNHGGSHVTSRNSSSRNDEDSSANGQPARELWRGFQSSRTGNESASSSGQRTECDTPEISGQRTECDAPEISGQRTEHDAPEINGKKTECDTPEINGKKTECDASEISGQRIECDTPEINGKKTECDASEINGQRAECDASEITVFNRDRAGHHTSLGSSIEANPSTGDHRCENKHLTKVTDTDLESESSEDGVLLLTLSDSSTSASTHSQGARLANRERETGTSKDNCEKSKLLSSLPGGHRKAHFVASSRVRQQTKASRKVSLQTALSAIMESESDDSQTSMVGVDFLNSSEGGELSSPIAQPSGLSQPSKLAGLSQPSTLAGLSQPSTLAGLSQPSTLAGLSKPSTLAGLSQPSTLAGLSQPSTLAGLSQPSTLAGLSQLAGPAELSKPPDKHNGPKNANIYTDLKVRFGLQDKTADSEKLSAFNKFGSNSQLCGDLDVESNDSLDTPLVIDESPRGSEVEEESFSPPTQSAEGPSQSSRVCIGSKDSNSDSLLKKRNGDEEELLDLCEDSASDGSTSGACCQLAGQGQEAVSSLGHWAGSQDIKHTGFATLHFFRQKRAPITPNQRTVENSEKPILVVGSNSDTSQDSVMLKAQSDNSDLGEMLETKAKPSAQEKTEKHADLWKSGRCSKAVFDIGEKAEHKRQANVLKAVPLGKAAYPYGQSRGSVKLKKKQQHECVRGENITEQLKLKKKQQHECVRGENITEQLMAAGDESDLSDIPLSHLQQINTKPKNSDHRGHCSAGPDNAEFSKRHEKVRHKCEQQPLKKKQRRESLEPPPKNASNLKGRVHASPSPFSPPLSPVVEKNPRQNQKLLVGKQTVHRRKSAWNICTTDTTSHKRSVSSLSESTDDEAVVNRSLKTSLEKANGRKGRGTFSVFKTGIVPSKKLQFALTDSIGEQVCSVVRNSTTARGGCGSHGQSKSNEPWQAVPYKGETLKFPVIKLQDVRHSNSHTPGDCGEEIASRCGRERNLFDFFKSSSQREQDCLAVVEPDCVDAASETSTSSSCLPKLAKTREQSVASSSERGCSVRMKQAGSLDESRQVLRKQRTVKRLAPKLCTTLRLRKQASPNKLNSSSEVEEWTVVTQDNQPGSSYCQREFSQHQGLRRKVCAVLLVAVVCVPNRVKILYLGVVTVVFFVELTVSGTLCVITIFLFLFLKWHVWLFKCFSFISLCVIM